MPCAWVYILRLRDGRLYTGWAVDPLRRLELHRSGRGSRMVRAFGPAELVYLEPLPDRGAALRREAAIKRLARRSKLQLVAGAARATSGHRRRLERDG